MAHIVRRIAPCPLRLAACDLGSQPRARVIENATDTSWFQVKNAMAGIKVGIHRTQAGEVWLALNSKWA